MEKQVKYLKLTGVFLGIVVLTIGVFHLFFWNKIYPGVYVAGIHLGGKTKNQALNLIEKDANYPPLFTLLTQEDTFLLRDKEISLEYQKIKTVDEAFAFGRKDNLVRTYKEIWWALKDGVNLPFAYFFDERALTALIESVDKKTSVSEVRPKIEISKGQITIKAGKEGKLVDKSLLKEKITTAFSYLDTNPIVIPINTNKPLSREEVENLKSRAEKFIGQGITLSTDDLSISFKDSDLVNLLDGKGGFSSQAIGEVVEDIVKKTERPVQNATFRFESGRVIEFKPAKDGVVVQKEQLKSAVIEKLTVIEAGQKAEWKISLPVSRTKPPVTTDSVNNLGIKELIGRGTSRFRGSSPSRVHNISLASQRLNGILIPPGEIFSFNSAVGDVSSLTGYQQAYVIDKGKIILGDGGGVCQVSTTFFRAALSAGLPIIERRAHSYRVSYYEQDSSPGIDATVYSPAPDFKIKNDTLAHILIQTNFDPKTMNLTLDFYGTDDGRVATISKPKITDVTPPPPDDTYQNDPTLPAGIVKQVNPRVSGAKTAFNYKVTRGFETLQDKTFYSIYRPWQGLYLRGTGPTTQ